MKESVQLYRALLKQANEFSSYNFRVYAQEKVRHSFRRSQGLSDDELINKAKEALEMLKRQTTINKWYSRDSLVIDKKKR